MIVVTIYDEGGGNKFMVFDGQAKDVTHQFEVHALVMQDDQGHIGGYHIGKRLTPEDTLELYETTQDENDGS